MKPHSIKALLGNKAFNVIEINETKITLLDESKPNGRLVIETNQVKIYQRCAKIRKKKRPRIVADKSAAAILSDNISKLIREFKNRKHER